MERTSATYTNGNRDPDQIQREIEYARDQLAETVAAVVERANVKRRAQRRAQRGAEAMRRRSVPVAVGGVAVVAAGVTVWALWQRRNESRWEKAKRWSRERMANMPSISVPDVPDPPSIR